MWRLLAFCLIALTALAAPCDPRQQNGLVWQTTGDWNAGRPGKLAFMDRIALPQLKPANPTADNQIIILLNGSFFKRICKRGGSCSEECYPATPGVTPAQLSPPVFDRVKGAEQRPEFRAAMSRAGGWRDSVVALNPDGVIELGPVFQGTARTIRLRFCSTDPGAACAEQYFIARWDGQIAPAQTRGIAPGLYRLVEDDNQSDAWVRVVNAANAPAVRAEYQAAAGVVRSWQLPEADEPLPSLDRFLRLLLANLGDGR